MLPAWKALGIDASAFSDGGDGSWKPVDTQPPSRVLQLDMAVDLGHPALTRALSYDLARNLDYPNVAKGLHHLSGAARPRSGRDPVRAAYEFAFSSISSGHGTACAGVIAASVLDGGTLGIAPRATVIPYRAMTLTEPVLEKRQVLARAVLEIFANGFDRDQRLVDVLYCPLPFRALPSGKMKDDPLPFAVYFAASKIPVVLASGNDGTGAASYLGDVERFKKQVGDLASFDKLVKLFGIDKATLKGLLGLKDGDDLKDFLKELAEPPGLIVVGACNNKGFRSRYSQYGEHLTLVAPSDDDLPPKTEAQEGGPPSDRDRRRSAAIATTDSVGPAGFEPADDFYTLSDNAYGFGGTSAASAQVAGVVALMLEANPRLTAKAVRAILCKTARTDLLLLDDGSTPQGRTKAFGHGLVDAGAAVAAAKGGAGDMTNQET